MLKRRIRNEAMPRQMLARLTDGCGLESARDLPTTAALPFDPELSPPRQLDNLRRIADYRKRQILERMLME